MSGEGEKVGTATSTLTKQDRATRAVRMWPDPVHWDE